MNRKLLISLMIGLCGAALVGCFDSEPGEPSGGTFAEGGAGSGGPGAEPPGDGSPPVGMSDTASGSGPGLPPSEPGAGKQPSADEQPAAEEGTPEEGAGDGDGEPGGDEPPACELECKRGTHCVLEETCAGGKQGDGADFVPCEPRVEAVCVPNPPCGKEDLMCEGLGECIDNPTDDCNPELHDGCAGVCVCEVHESCPEGTRFDDSFEVCDCVELEGGDMPKDTVEEDPAPEHETCGDTICAEGSVCCNAKCGICAPASFVPSDFCESITC